MGADPHPFDADAQLRGMITVLAELGTNCEEGASPSATLVSWSAAGMSMTSIPQKSGESSQKMEPNVPASNSLESWATMASSPPPGGSSSVPMDRVNSLASANAYCHSRGLGVFG